MSDELKDKIENENINGEEFVAIPSETPITEEELEKAEQIMTDNDEIAAFNKEVLCQLESPLIVHKKTDSSYEESATNFEMNETHIDEEKPTLTRHRFKKDPKKKGRGLRVLAVIFVILAAIFAGLLYTGNIPLDIKNEKTTKAEQTTAPQETTTTIEEKYVGTIVIKNNYVFVDGVEVDGVNGLQKALKYVEPSTTAYKIIIEGTAEDFSDDFYNYEIYPYLLQLGFIGEDTEIQHIQSTGLVAEAELTTKAETTTKKAKKKASKSGDNTNTTVVEGNNDN